MGPLSLPVANVAEFKWKQIAETFMDPKTWMFVGIILPKAITAGGISAFGPLVIQG